MRSLLSYSINAYSDSDQVWEKLVEALLPVLSLLRVDDGGVGDAVDAAGGGGGEEQLVEDVFADGRWVCQDVFEGAVPIVGDLDLQFRLGLGIELYVASGIHVVRFLGGRNLLDLDDLLVGGVGAVDEVDVVVVDVGNAGVVPVQKRQHAVAAVSKAAAACCPLSTAIGRPWSCC